MELQYTKHKNKEEWLKDRGMSIGGSEVTTILGLNPYETPYELWLRKTNKVPPLERNKFMIAGQYTEMAIAAWFNGETEHSVIKASEGDIIYRHPEYSFLVASPDRRVFLFGSQKQEDKAIYEAKSTGLKFDHDEIPMSWFLQPQYYAGILGYNHIVINWYQRFQNDFYYKIYDFDQSIYDTIIEECVDFWNNHVIADVPPPERTASDTLKLFPESVTDKLIVATDEVEEVYQQAIKYQREEKHNSTEKDKYIDKLKMIMKDNEKIVSMNLETLCTWKSNVNGVRVFSLKEI